MSDECAKVPKEFLMKYVSGKLADDRAYRIADQFAEDHVRSWGRPTGLAPDEYLIDDDPCGMNDLMIDCLGHLQWRGIAHSDSIDEHHVIVRFLEES